MYFYRERKINLLNYCLEIVLLFKVYLLTLIFLGSFCRNISSRIKVIHVTFNVMVKTSCKHVDKQDRNKLLFRNHTRRISKFCERTVRGLVQFGVNNKSMITYVSTVHIIDVIRTHGDVNVLKTHYFVF